MSTAFSRVAGLCLGLTLLLCSSLALANNASPLSGRDLVIMTEGFEDSWPPAGWLEITTHVVNWRRSNYASHSGTYSATCSWTPATQDEWLVTSAIDLTGAIDPKLEFYEHETDWSTGYHHYIGVSTTVQDDPSAFTMLTDWTPANHTINGFDGEPVIVSLSDYIDEPVVYIAFRYRGLVSHQDTWYVDDVRVYMPNDHDVMTVSVLPDGDQLPGGTVITPQAVVENNGLNTESFDVSMEISQSGSPVYSEILHVSSLAPGFQEALIFPDLTLASGHYFELTATTLLAGDEDASNDAYSTYVDTYSEQHVPMGFIFTNSGCGPCAPANQALDTYMASAGNEVALLRIHVSWPYGGDIIYLANTAQSNALVTEFGVDGVPAFFLDAFWDLGYIGSAMVAALNTGRTWMSPINIDLTWDDDADQLTVSVNVVNALVPGGEYALFCAITEDNIYHNGGNGEPIHNQAFRYMYPDVYGGISVPATMGSHVFVVDCPLSGGWAYDELRASVYVRNMISGTIVQSGTNFLNNIDDPSAAEGTESFPFHLGANYPNPFNPKTTITYSLDEASLVSLRVFDLEGRLVTTLVERSVGAGEHSVVWDGRDDAGNAVASGVYLYRLISGERSEMNKMLLIK